MTAALLPLLLLVFGGGLAVLALRLYQASLARRERRAGYFSAVLPQMQRLRQQITPCGFPRVSGEIQGVETDLQIIPDTLTYRKLPTLWLLVTQPCPLPLRQRIHLMIRPRGAEAFSAFHDLAFQTRPGEGLPYDAGLRSEQPLTPGEAALLRRHSHLFADPRLKELVIAPEGLRLSWLADEADRGRYLIFREAEMGNIPLAPADLAPLLAGLAALRDDILSPGCERKCA
ncbi:hypothetical protein [Pseudogemmobacter faecipullorum]|uniref:DUF3137 domain-containing protein n=1 Tax=Pseudogemmobacter faecipullorum TaxID=2755041 RepID=A0ABS8CKG0_9RHOB|nr:hypothetical protein [Pseudogemmobacter faecipullorum]MCB5409877.1 hypothetical protein [Pseudogemmobacter faecipullorum]